jgi:hypothetical protein
MYHRFIVVVADLFQSEEEVQSLGLTPIERRLSSTR